MKSFVISTILRNKLVLINVYMKIRGQSNRSIREVWWCTWWRRRNAWVSRYYCGIRCWYYRWLHAMMLSNNRNANLTLTLIFDILVERVWNGRNIPNDYWNEKKIGRRSFNSAFVTKSIKINLKNRVNKPMIKSPSSIYSSVFRSVDSLGGMVRYK